MPQAGADELAAYLERLRLNRLLVEHLERELASGLGSEDRSRLVERLAELYPELLEREQDPAKRAELAKASQAFLERENPKQGDVLRLSLLRARYRSAARAAEDVRVALVDDAAGGVANQQLEAIAKEAGQLRQRLELRVRDLERRSDRTGGFEGELAVGKTDRVRGLLQEALSLEAWSLYYRSVLGGDRGLADAAQGLFARILDTGSAYPSPKDVSLDLRANEFYANAVLGMALAKSRTESLPTALEWLALLEEPRTAESIRRQLPAWRLVAAIDRREFAQAREILKPLLADSSAPVPWLRLAAVGGLRAEGEAAANPDARALAREAIAGLASRRELGQVADLARRFGDAALGTNGFAPLYVKGVLAFERAKGLGDRGAALESYGEAVEALGLALGSGDAGDYGPAAATCRSLLGWGHYERGEYQAAFEAFDKASELAAARDEEADWMSLVCLEKLLPGAGDGRSELESQLRSRMDRFLAKHPSSDKVPQLLQRRMALSDAPRREDLDRLLGMDDRTPGAAEGKRQAVAGYYRLFRATAEGDAKIEIGQRFLDAAKHLGPDDGHHFDGLPGGDVVIARQVLEVALASGIGDLEFASGVLDRLEALVAAKQVDASSFVGELAVRRVQIELGRDRLDPALERLAALEAGGEAMAKPLDVARRYVFRWASSHFGDAQPPVPRKAIVMAAWRTGQALLATAANGAPLEQALSSDVASAVAQRTFEAGVEAFLATDDRAVGEQALAIGKALLSRSPRDPALLESIAALAGPLGDRDLASQSLRRIVAGTNQGSDRWFRAKLALLELLAASDPAQARAVLEQHKQLRPDLGPAPYGDRFRELDRTLPPAPPQPGESPPAAPAPAGGSQP